VTWPIPPVSYPLPDPDHGRAMIDAISDWAPVVAEDGPTVDRVYHDTFDWRIHRDGGTLESMHRAWSWRDRSGHSAHHRQAGRPPAFAWDLPSGDLRTALGAVIEMRRLLPRVRVHIESRILRVLDDEQKTVVRVAFESGRASLPDSDETKPLPGRVQVLPVRGYVAEFRAVTSFLESRFPLEADNRSELETALSALGAKPADYSGKVALHLDPDLAAADATRLIHRSLLATMMRNEAGTKADTDSEFLHDFRVSIRRTRSALTQIRGVFPEAELERFRDGFKWMGTATGPVRDLDVWLLKLDGYRRTLPEAIRPHLDALDVFLRAEQRREQRKLARTLGSKEYAALIDNWRRFLAGATPDVDAPPNARRPVAEVASERIHKVYRRVLKRGGKITVDTPADALHRLRIDGKKLRYLLEFFRSLYDADEIGRLVRALKLLQDNLGDFNDYEVQQASLGAFADRMTAGGKAPAETLMAMGRLVERLEQGQQEERERFQACFGRFARKSGRGRIDRLFGGTAS